MSESGPYDVEQDAVAVIGMSGRFPGARSVAELWHNLRHGVESIRFFSDEELLAAGIDAATLADPRYVKARGFLEDAECFDAALFGYNPKEALCMDPQHRLFLECAWSALEDAGYLGESLDVPVGVFGGCSFNTYFLGNLGSPVLESMRGLNLMLNNDKDALTMRVSYQLDLKGPSITVQTACSTSLVAVTQACQNLMAYECDIALAGGVCVGAPRIGGYMYQEEGISSPDGHCRAFDAHAQGTVGGEGVAIVVLKRLSEALDDGDRILGVLKGWSANNDGRQKVGYTAPGVEGQAQAIAAAQALAGVSADSISFVETHGTGTPLGDPVEVAALSRAFRATTDRQQFCAIGSVKTNLGHLDAAAGVTGLIKAVLCVHHAELPPSLHFESPNPALELESSPFYVNSTLKPWPSGEGPRRAGVSSFGMGGTNAHVVVEAPPAAPESDPPRSHELLLLSAASSNALDRMTDNLSARLRDDPRINLADVASTLQVGRKRLGHRLSVVCTDPAQAALSLSARDPAVMTRVKCALQERDVAFMFPGQGSQYPNMGRGLYDEEDVFHDAVDTCCARLRDALELDLREVLFPAPGHTAEAAERLTQTWLTQPALFTVEYALAQLWMAWGVKPSAMLGHSIGEYVAACLAGVWTLDEALDLVAARGRLMHEQPPGAMLAVVLPASDLELMLDARLAVASINEPGMSVASGPDEAVKKLEATLSAKGLASRRLHTSHAFHSPMMDPVLAPFTRLVAQTRMQTPSIPFISNLSGDWIAPGDATDSNYWARHLRGCVRFADGVDRLMDTGEPVLLEVGPGNTLATMATRNPRCTRGHPMASTLRHAQEESPDRLTLLKAAGALWQHGVAMDWRATHGNRRQRVALPTYPFERKRFWLDDRAATTSRAAHRVTLTKEPDVGRWLYTPGWRTRALIQQPADDAGPVTWLVLADTFGIGEHLATLAAQRGEAVVLLRRGARPGADQIPGVLERELHGPDDYPALISELPLATDGTLAIAHAWSAVPGDAPADSASMESALGAGFFSLLALAQALPAELLTRTRIAVITRGLQQVHGLESLRAETAPVLGLCRVLPQELEGLRCAAIDVEIPSVQTREPVAVSELAIHLKRELLAGCPDRLVAWRGSRRWVQTVDRAPAGNESPPPQPCKSWLITGGLGHVGFTLARHLAARPGVQLAITSRDALPPRETWQALLAGDADEHTCRRIRAVMELEDCGASVMVLPVDLTTPDQVHAAVAQVLQRFDGIDGVIHAAGGARETGMHSIRELDPVKCEQQFAPKMTGTMNLAAALQQARPRLVLLMSSLSTNLGGIGFAAYAAANAFMDAYAQQHSSCGHTRWLSVNWDGWWFGDDDPASRTSLTARLAMTPQEGTQAFDALLADNSEPQVIVSTANLELRRLQLDRLESSDEDTTGDVDDDGQEGERPELDQDYVAPRDETERAIADIWSEMLGIDRVGVHDNFYELGGHSLLALQIATRLGERFGLVVSLGEMLKRPTVVEIAGICGADSATGSLDEQRAAAVVMNVDAMSEEDIDRMLTEPRDAQNPHKGTE